MLKKITAVAIGLVMGVAVMASVAPEASAATPKPRLHTSSQATAHTVNTLVATSIKCDLISVAGSPNTNMQLCANGNLVSGVQVSAVGCPVGSVVTGYFDGNGAGWTDTFTVGAWQPRMNYTFNTSGLPRVYDGKGKIGIACGSRFYSKTLRLT